MRIHRVRLRNYRGVVDTAVDFSTEGVTIVEGANETGKTCIPQAIDLILDKPDSSGAKAVKDVRPVHRDEAPEVEIEMSAGPYRFVYGKRWLRRPQTVLTLAAPRSEQVNGRPAHDRVRSIMDETVDETLWRALRVEQWAGAGASGGMVIPTLNAQSLVQALDVAVGGDATGDHEDHLWRRICDERARYWTASGRVKQDRNELKREAEESCQEVEDIRRRLREIEQDAARVGRLRSERARLIAVHREYEEKEQDQRDRLSTAEELRGRVERLESVHREAVAQKDRIVGEQGRREDLMKAAESRQAELERLRADARQSAPAIEAAIADSREARSDLDRARAALDRAEADHRRARRDHDHQRAVIDLAQFRERRGRVMIAQEDLRRSESILETAGVDEELLNRIEEAHLAVVRAEAAVETAGAKLEGTALAEITMVIDGREMTLGAGETISRVVAEEVKLVVPAVAELRIVAGAESRNLSSDLAAARRNLRNLCDLAGVSDLGEARRRAAARREAERSRLELIAAIKRDLRDLTPGIMQEKIEGLSQRIDRYNAERPAHPPLPPTYEEAKRIATESEQALGAHQSRFDMSRKAARSAEERYRESELGKATLEGRIGDARTAWEEAERRLASAREERPDEDLADQLRSAQARVDEARESLRRAREDLRTADPASLRILLDNARSAARRARGDLERNEKEERELRASLRFRGEAGLHTRLGEAERRMRHLQHRHDRNEARARSAQLLWSTFGERRQESRQRYHAPLTERIAELGRVVFGPTFAVELGDNLEVARRSLDGVRLDVDQLSAGAREQLGLLSRLACAMIVSPDGGGAPVMIDDALGWSDPDRLSRMGAALGVAGKQCQIIILTCTPGRYAHVGDARVVSLPASAGAGV